MKRPLLETGKTLLIILLIASMLLLFVASMPADMIRSSPGLSAALQPFAPLLGLPTAELAYVAEAQSVQSAAQPLTISVKNSAGRYTAQWDFSSLDAAYDALGSLLGQALDTAGSLSPVSTSTLTQALSQASVCFDYGVELPVTLIALWLDVPWEQSVPDSNCYILSVEEDRVRLYLAGEVSYGADTQLDPETVTGLLEHFAADGSQFAFEAGSHLDPLSLLPAAAPAMGPAELRSLCDNRYIEALANGLGFNPYDDSRYTDSAGVTHFSESGSSLQVSGSGDVLLTVSVQRFRAADSSPAGLVEQARNLLMLAVQDTDTTRLYLSGVTQSGTETVCSFDYVLNGVPVSWPDGPAAQVTFSDRFVTRLELKAVGFTPTDQVQQLLPPLQTAAILKKNDSLKLEYHPADGALMIGWAQ